MQCPICNVQLTMTERQEIEIDYCPQCRGIWLDRGELDKLIERSRTALYSNASDERPAYREHEGHDDPRRRERRSFLGDLFDFD